MLLNRTHKIAAQFMSQSAHALGVCRLFSYTISLVSLGEAILSLSISMSFAHSYFVFQTIKLVLIPRNLIRYTSLINRALAP